MTVQEMPCRDDMRYVTPVRKAHPAYTSIRHWQLRDLLWCPSVKDQVVHVYENAVMETDLRTGRSTAIVSDLSYMPVSLTAKGDVVVCGGQLGELTVLRRSTGATHTLSLGSSINNAAHIASHFGDDALFVSNNDRFVHVFGLNDLTLRDAIELPAPVNHASMSPDGRHFIACGDTDSVYLFDVRQGGYHSRIALPMGCDAVFSTAWSAASDIFAAASQDGLVFAWDVRHLRDPIARLSSLGSASPTAGADAPPRSFAAAAASIPSSDQPRRAVRSVRFSTSGSLDLLVFAEHASVVHIVDARTFQQRQIVAAIDDAYSVGGGVGGGSGAPSTSASPSASHAHAHASSQASHAHPHASSQPSQSSLSRSAAMRLAAVSSSRSGGSGNGGDGGVAMAASRRTSSIPSTTSSSSSATVSRHRDPFMMSPQYVMPPRDFDYGPVSRVPYGDGGYVSSLAGFGRRNQLDDIAGVAFSPDCHALYVATPERIVEYTVNTVSRRCFPAASFR